MTQITVVKRSGQREPLTIEKWQAQVAKVCQGIADVSQSMIEIKAQLHFYDGITTEEIDEDGIDSESVIKSFLLELEDFMKSENLNENELKLGNALYDLFENYETIFVGTGNNKFNKNVILLSLREMTNLSTKEIRSSMKRFKKLYILLQSKMKIE